MRVRAIVFGIALALLAVQPSRGAVDVALGRAEAPLNGPWQFRFGNDPRWSSPQFDDRDWERVDLTPAAGAHDGDVGLPGYVPGWTARSHAGRWGHAWYRLHIRWTGPAGPPPVLLGPTLVDDAYEIYWNGKRIGGIGNFEANPPIIYGVRPRLFGLGGSSSAGNGVLAIHVYLPKTSADDPEAGGIHVAPILAEPAEGAALYLAQWWRSYWGYVVDLIEPLMLLGLALFGLSMRRFAPNDRFLPWASGAIAAIAASRINQPLYYWSGAESLQTLVIARYVVAGPLSVVAWIIACNRLGARSNRVVDAAAALCGLVAGLAALPGIDAVDIQSFCRAILLALFCWSMLNVARGASERFLASATSIVMAVALFADELSVVGVPGIWFPLGVGVSRTQFALACAIPMLTVLFFRRAPPTMPQDADVPGGRIIAAPISAGISR